MVALQDIDGTPQIGWVTKPGGATLQAEFCLHGERTYIRLHEKGPRAVKHESIALLPVRMTDGTHLTFLDNVLTGATSFHGGGGSVLNFRPRFVTVGRAPVEDGYTIASISFSVDDAEAIFYDFDAFSIALSGGAMVKELVSERAASAGRPIETGEHPILAYFTGKFEILSSETNAGRLSVRHSPAHGMGGPGGVSITNRIIVQLDLPSPTNIAGAIEHLMPHLRFLQLIGGRKQKVSRLRVKPNGGDDRTWLELVWCFAWSGELDGERPQPADLPINGGISPVEFSKVLTAWIAEEPERRDARVRYSQSSGLGRIYTIDRLVSAANMFDILPPGCFSTPDPLDADFAAARAEAKRLFKALPKSDMRDRALGDLGRLGQLNLKAKVLQRAQRVAQIAAGKYPHLDQLLRNAVDSRNHYVHGAQADAATATFFREMLSFHVDALEFVFAASDLLDAGWDYHAWARQGTTMSHPMGEFQANYARRAVDYMDRFRKLKAVAG